MDGLVGERGVSLGAERGADRAAGTPSERWGRQCAGQVARSAVRIRSGGLLLGDTTIQFCEARNADLRPAGTTTATISITTTTTI
jgi:hypothetical protein